ncbi:hypothetical protein BH10PSE14_BH10PSE14_07000 [soil metagenome]
MADTMIERAARALCGSAGRDPDARDAGADEPNWRDFADDVRTVLVTARELPEETFRAALESDDVVAWGDYREFWRAVIDAVLAEGA